MSVEHSLLAEPAEPGAAPRAAFVLASGADALTPYLREALGRNFDTASTIHADLGGWRRLLVAAATVRPSRRAWVERFYKSELAYRLRTRSAARQLRHAANPEELVLQTHALFAVRSPVILYVDCTHRQSAREWADWNPLGPRALRRWYAREREQYANAEHIFAFCEPTRQSLVLDYGIAPDRVTVVGAGANVSDLPPARAQRPAGPPTVLFVGNDFVRKGGPELLRAFTQVRACIPDARLLIVGTKHRIQAQAGVEVLGRINDREVMAELYKRADVFCLPSHFDPFPLSILEAMAFSIPVVATSTCGVPEMVDDGVTGSLVSPGSESALAEALTALLSSPETAAEMGRRGRHVVEHEFRWESVVARMRPVLLRFSEVTRGGDTP